MSETLRDILALFLRPGEILLELAGPNPAAASYILTAALISFAIWMCCLVILRRIALNILAPRGRLS